MNKQDLIVELHYVAYNNFTKYWEIEKRALPDYEFLYIVSGSGYVVADQKKIPVSSQDLILVPPGFSHSMHSEQLPFELWCAHFNAFHQLPQKGTPYSSQNANGIINGLFLPKWGMSQSQLELQRWLINMDLVTHLTGHNSISLALRINELMKSDLGENIGSIRRLVCDLLETVSFHTEPPQKPMEFVKSYIEAHFEQKITLSLLSSLSHLQPSYISALFKKQYGVTVTEYINQCRISAAKSYLSYTEETLEQIASKTGFFDTSHFCRTFMSKEGISPKKYRNLFHR